MLSKLKLVWKLWRYLGTGWVLFRIKYALQMRSGWLQRRMPAFQWSDRPLSSWLKAGVPSDPDAYKAWRQQHRGCFFFDQLPQIPDTVSWDTQTVIEEAEAILAGKWRYFSYRVHDVGFPPDWHLNPMTGQSIPADRHWTQISDFGQGDIKLVWEASRFSVVFILVRAYAATKDERYAEAFWTLIEDWADKNPPNMGPNWKCGQEATFRVMAWCFSLYGFAHSPHTTTERVATISAMLAVHAERIEKNIAYARAQKNNHGISEGMGLWTIGLLFPEFKRASHWRKQGRQIIEEEVSRQIYDDGSYVQHSMNYHRIMLHDLIWALRLGEINDERLSDDVYKKFGKAVNFLYQLLDDESGQVPNYGANDGALILPLNSCDCLDYRPVIQAGYYLLNANHLFPCALYDEDLLWLFGSEPLIRSSKPSARLLEKTNLSATAGGYYTLRGKQSWAMVRCAEYRDRPGHADQLHFDLWWRGQNIACDAGSYLYNGENSWDTGMSGTNTHNTVMVDNVDQMTRASRFQWIDWAQGAASHHIRSKKGHLAYWEGSHYGYRPVNHHRAIIQIVDESWLILDTLTSPNIHDYRLHWLMPDFPYQWDNEDEYLTMDTPVGTYRVQSGIWNSDGRYELVRGSVQSERGWRSQYYATKEPAISLTLTARSAYTRFWTIFSPVKNTVTATEDLFYIEWQDMAAVSVVLTQNGTVKSVKLTGELEDNLEVRE